MPSRRAFSSLSTLCILALLFSLVSCAPSESGSSNAKVYRLAVIPKGMTHVFWKSIHSGALQAARDLNKERGIEVEIKWQGPLLEDDREGQRQIIETFVGQNVDGIVLAPLDEHAMVGPVSRAMAAGKPVVIIDSGLNGDNYISFVATDNYKGGVLAANRLGGLLGGKGKVLLLRYMVGSASTTGREQGFIDTMRGSFPEIELLPPGLEQYAGATSGKAQEAAETLLNTYTDVDGIFCPNESSATGMLEALKRTARGGRIKFVGFDSSDKLVQGLRDGRIHGLILQDPVGMAARGVRTIVEYLEKKQVEKLISTGVFLITKETMTTPEGQRLLSPDLSILDGA